LVDLSQPLSRSSAAMLSLADVNGSIPVVGSGSFWRKLGAFAGPGYLVAVGYMDPGNWATDIAGGSAFGYTLLSVILLSSLMAMVLQALSARLGIATDSISPKRAAPTIHAPFPPLSGSSARLRSAPVTSPGCRALVGKVFSAEGLSATRPVQRQVLELFHAQIAHVTPSCENCTSSEEARAAASDAPMPPSLIRCSQTAAPWQYGVRL
jgi:hypothetical protein